MKYILGGKKNGEISGSNENQYVSIHDPVNTVVCNTDTHSMLWCIHMS